MAVQVQVVPVLDLAAEVARVLQRFYGSTPPPVDLVAALEQAIATTSEETSRAAGHLDDPAWTGPTHEIVVGRRSFGFGRSVVDRAPHQYGLHPASPGPVDELRTTLPAWVEPAVDPGATPRTIPMGELNQQTSRTLEALAEARAPGVVTRHGRSVALILPVVPGSVEVAAIRALQGAESIETVDSVVNEPSHRNDFVPLEEFVRRAK